MENNNKWQAIACLPENYDEIRTGAYTRERLEGIDLERYNQIIEQMLQEHGLTRRGYEIGTAPGAETGNTDLRQLLQDAQKKLVEEVDQKFDAAEEKLRAYIQAHDELKTCMANWEDMERDDYTDEYWVSLYESDQEEAEIAWLLKYDMEDGSIRQDKM